MESILASIRKLLPIGDGETHFDPDLMLHINSVLAVLTQLGVGPKAGFSIADEKAVWSDFLPSGPRLGFVKTYVYLKVRLLFDPPQASAAIEAIRRQADELEWRILVEAEDHPQT